MGSGRGKTLRRGRSAGKRGMGEKPLAEVRGLKAGLPHSAPDQEQLATTSVTFLPMLLSDPFNSSWIYFCIPKGYYFFLIN